MKKLLLLVLALTMILGVLASCKKDEQPAEQPPVQTDAPKENPFPAKDFQGEEFQILMSQQMDGSCYIAEEAVNDYQESIFESYQAVEENYSIGISIEPASCQYGDLADFTNKIAQGYNSGDDGYDLIMGQACLIYTQAFNGYYSNLKKSEYLNLDADYYYQFINEQYSMENQLYAAAGAYTMDKVGMSIVCFFNKTLLEQYFGETEYSNLYDVVRSGNWTLEVMKTIAETVKNDEGGDGVWNETDRYGFLGVNAGVAAIVSSGFEGVAQNADGTYSFTFYSERLANFVRDYGEFFANDYVRDGGTYNDEPKFTSGNAMFYASHLKTIERMRGEATFNIGVLPFPKYDLSQTEYRTYVNRSEMCFIPSNASAELSGLVLEYINYLFLEDVIPAYWEETMKSRYSAEPADAEMMELARKGAFEDLAYAYRFELGDFYVSVNQLIGTKGDVSAWWQGVEGPAKIALDGLVESHREMAAKGF